MPHGHVVIVRGMTRGMMAIRRVWKEARFGFRAWSPEELDRDHASERLCGIGRPIDSREFGSDLDGGGDHVGRRRRIGGEGGSIGNGSRKRFYGIISTGVWDGTSRCGGATTRVGA